MIALAHPATVHLPLAFAVLFPFVLAGTVWAIETRRLPRGFWIAIWLLSVVHVGASWLAYHTGAQARVFSMANADLVTRHSRLAEIFMILSLLIMLGLAATWLVRKASLLRTLYLILAILVIAQFVIGIFVGQAGGILMTG